jgi:hypothetical protein
MPLVFLMMVGPKRLRYELEQMKLPSELVHVRDSSVHLKLAFVSS